MSKNATAMAHDDDLEAFTIEEVAERLRVSPDTIRERIADGSLGHIREGRKLIRVLPSQLRAYLRRDLDD